MEPFLAWLNKPFSSDMSAAKWFAFFGLMLAISALWGVILHHMQDS